MPNERLRSAVLTSGVGVQGVADALNVDRKTVERWIGGRDPYRKHQFALSALLHTDLVYLWPDSRSASDINAAAEAELVNIYPHRSAAPSSLWLDTLGGAESSLDIVVFAGFWLSEDHRFHQLLKDKAAAGAKVRMALGNPECAAVRQRGHDEGIGEAIAGKIRNVIHNYQPLMKLKNVEFRLHDTVLYNSIYRADDEMLVTPHIYGAPAYAAPVLHLHRLPTGDLFHTYLDSFERIWTATQAIPEAMNEVAA